MKRSLALAIAIVLGTALGASAQEHGTSMHHHDDHAAMQHDDGAMPTMPGQDAFGAIAEVVRLLEADPTTDWSKVDLERLRQHLVDMNEVTLNAVVKQATVSGGLAMDVTGTGRSEQSIERMVTAHAAVLDGMPAWSAHVEPIARGVRLTVIAKKPDDAGTIARIRGLGFIGLLTEGGHHGPHHLAMARGEVIEHHAH